MSHVVVLSYSCQLLVAKRVACASLVAFAGEVEIGIVNLRIMSSTHGMQALALSMPTGALCVVHLDECNAWRVRGWPLAR